MKLELIADEPVQPGAPIVTPSLERIVDRQIALRAFALRFLDPEDLGYAVNACVRDAAREALGMPRAETIHAARNPIGKATP